MVGIATAIWSGTSNVPIADAWNELEPDRLTFIGTLMVAAAYGDGGLPDWLEIYGRDRKSAGCRPLH